MCDTLKKISIVIRADGGNSLGMGHIVRTSSLAKVLKEYAIVSYICDETYVQGIIYLEEQGFKVYSVEKKSILSYIEELKPNILITDHYGIDTNYMECVRRACGQVVYIDDNCSKALDADLVLNQNYGAEYLSYDKVVGNQCIKLLGSQYTLLGEGFRASESIRIKNTIKHILITVGGGDSDNITDKILQQVANMPYTFHVVIGGHFPYEEQLRKEYNRSNVYFYKQPQMYKLMSNVDMAISSCGTTLYELGSLGIPTIGLIVADNQKQLAERMNQDGLIILIGHKRDVLTKNLSQIVYTLANNRVLRKNMWERTTTAFNKKGVYKVIRNILNLTAYEGEER